MIFFFVNLSFIFAFQSSGFSQEYFNKTILKVSKLSVYFYIHIYVYINIRRE